MAIQTEAGTIPLTQIGPLLYRDDSTGQTWYDFHQGQLPIPAGLVKADASGQPEQLQENDYGFTPFTSGANNAAWAQFNKTQADSARANWHPDEGSSNPFSAWADSAVEFAPYAAAFVGGINGLQYAGALPAGNAAGAATASGVEAWGSGVPEYSYTAGPASGAGSVTTDVVNTGGQGGFTPDAISQIAQDTAGNNMTMSEVAASKGFASTEAYLSSINPAWVSAIPAGLTAASVASYLGKLAPAAITGGLALLGGKAGANAAKDAANIQSSATDRAIAAQQASAQAALDENRRQYDTNRSDLAPYRDAGNSALARLKTLMGLDPGGDTSTAALTRKFTTDDLNADVPYNTGLQFGLDQGTGAINARAAQAGNYDSGATLKALTRYANDYGTTKAADAYGRFTGEQNNTFNKLSGTANYGVNAVNTGVNAGTNMSNNIANTLTNSGTNTANLIGQQGNAQAAGAVGAANAYTNAIGQGVNAYNQYQNSETLAALLRK